MKFLNLRCKFWFRACLLCISAPENKLRTEGRDYCGICDYCDIYQAYKLQNVSIQIWTIDMILMKNVC